MLEIIITNIYMYQEKHIEKNSNKIKSSGHPETAWMFCARLDAEHLN